MLPSETMIWQPEFTDKTLSRKPGAVHILSVQRLFTVARFALLMLQLFGLLHRGYQLRHRHS
ncbi:hypothetical protein [Escherichia coli]|uniref:hypothetical protein n=1 Tax=Escherichia coli TaxID=562 RepID=UPI000B8A714B|nr:hypothetical protein [Escherichia coli]